jgi:hypothetical protein
MHVNSTSTSRQAVTPLVTSSATAHEGYHALVSTSVQAVHAQYGVSTMRNGLLKIGPRQQYRMTACLSLPLRAGCQAAG